MAILPQVKKKPLSIYIHIPFCRSKCLYCDFCSLPDQKQELMDDYLLALCQHIREAGPLAPNYQVVTIYFGGGTPSHFGAEGLAAILTTVRKHFDVSPKAEITFEANPESVTKKLLRRLKSEGFNRVSLGIQSDDDEILQTIGRPHTYEQATEAVTMIRKARFKNLSVDLIFGLPGQTLDGWLNTLSNVLTLKPDHISCYGLKLEEGTPLYENRKQYTLPDDDTQADMYLAAVAHLHAKGYRQYEISNFARPGMASAHNLRYWTGGEYLGFGPNASSDFGGKRFSMVDNVHEYIQGIRTQKTVVRDVQEIPSRERAGEYIMLGLRLTQGISKETYERKYLLPFTPLERVLERYVQTGHAECSGNRWRLTPSGLMISSSIISDILLAQDEALKNR